MRVRAFAAIVMVLLPAVLAGQQTRVRRPRIGAPPAKAPLPPRAPGLPQLRQYQSSRLSVESYTLFTVVQTDRYVADSGAAVWSMQGVGTRIDWRLASAFSITADLTSALVNGPFSMSTIDIGGRYQQEREGQVLRPYVDVRTTYGYSYAGYAQPYATNAIASPVAYVGGRTTSRGFGALVGAGFESSLTRSLAVTTGVSLARYRMSSVRVGQQRLGSDWNYGATTLRFTIGLTYNRQRLVPIPGE